jgi:RES domain-containing protein
MQVFRISKCRYINDLTGAGAAKFGGRWHSKGQHVLYTAATPSLALLESIVHLSGIVLDSYCLICLEIPERGIKQISVSELKKDWGQYPSPDHLKINGDTFLRESKHLVLRVPSVLMPEENNYLINPVHPDFKEISIIYTRELSLDKRLIKV